MKRAAVIVHPRKHHDLAGFRADVTKTMTVQGWAQIIVYMVLLVAIGYPLGLYMARVYHGVARKMLVLAEDKRDYKLAIPHARFIRDRFTFMDLL